MAVTIEFKNVSKRYAAGVIAVRNLSLTIAAGSIVALVGPSGCGKTTSLKMINRLIEPTDGEILLDGTPISKVPLPELRHSLGYVIQYVGLFPHMTVAENIAVVPRQLRWPKRRIDDRVDELLDLVGLPPAEFRERRPRALSGGQQQRVGVARALAANPPVLLMDEPFGALDPITRVRLQSELIAIQRKLHKTIVIVTHDMDEAVHLGDRVAVLQSGELIQFGAPAELLNTPANDFVSMILGKDRYLKLLRTLSVQVITKAASSPVDGPTVNDSASLEDALIAMLASSASAVSVVNSAGLVGHVSAADIMNIRTSLHRVIEVGHPELR